MCLTHNSLVVRHSSGSITVLLVYVDDILLMGNDVKFMDSLLVAFSNNFDMHSLRHLSQFFGIEFLKNDNGMVLSQERYARSIIYKADMDVCKSYNTPVSTKKACHFG